MTFRVTDADVEFTAIRAQGPGGQNVNKVSTAIHLRFDIRASRLPEPLQLRLLATRDHRITEDGVVVIKAQSERTQERNKAAALARLQAMIDQAAHVPKTRRPTQPTRASKQRRLKAKSVRAQLKAGRARVAE